MATRKHVLRAETPKGTPVMKRAIRPLVAVMAILLVLAVFPQRNSAGNGVDGYAWLAWNNDLRQLYLLSFLHAYRSGFADACLAASDIAKDWTIREIRACEDRQMSFSRDLPDLNRDITDFYREYPEDQSLGLDVLLRQFSDRKHRSPKEVHTLLENKQPL
jgi:hypothetical protein